MTGSTGLLSTRNQMSSNLQIAVGMQESPHRRPFSDSIPPLRSLIRPLLTCILSNVAAYSVFGSSPVLFIFLLSLLNALADILASIVLSPPFLKLGDPESGLSTDRSKLPSYWDSSTIRGPAAMNLSFVDVVIPIGSKNLRGWLIRPSGTIKAVIVMSHGAGRDRRSWLRHCNFLTAQGYAALLFDSRNHGLSDRVGAAGTTLGVLEWQDIVTAVRWAKAEFPPPIKIALMGTSTGATSSILAVSADPMCAAAVSAIVAENPFTSAGELAASIAEFTIVRGLVCRGHCGALFAALLPLRAALSALVRAHVVLRIARRCFVAAGDGSGAAQWGGAASAARRLPVPLLVIHGDKDKIAPLEHGQRIAATAAVGGKLESEIWVCEGADHCQTWDRSPAEFELRVIAFLNKYTK